MILFNTKGGVASHMVFGTRQAACPCNTCAKLAVPRFLSSATRIQHKKDYGIANDNVSLDDEAPASPPAQALVENVVAVQVPEEALSSLVNEEAFARDVVLLVVNSGITWKGAEDMVKVFNAHCRGKTLLHNLPATGHQLKRVTSCVRGTSMLYHACPKCDYVFDGDQGVCTPCGLPRMLRVKRQVLVNDVGSQITRMFANPMLARAFGYAATRVPGDGDVWDGEVMRDIPSGTHRARTNTLYARTHTQSDNGFTSIITYQH